MPQWLRSRSGRGTLYVMLSAVMFGVMPVMAKWTYQGGSNAVNLVFHRNALALPLLLPLAFRQAGKDGIVRSFLPVAWLAGILAGITSLLLYASYEYISVGMATTLHFVYPLVVALGSSVIFRKPLNGAQKSGLLLGMAGISLFAIGADGGGLTGILLALLSGVCYGGYMLTIGARELSGIASYALALQVAMISGLISGVFGVATGQMSFHLTPAAWGWTLLIAAGITVGACVLLQVGIRLGGATNAALLSLLEPITSVFAGIAFLGDRISVSKMAGCLLILSGLLLIMVLPGRPRRRTQTPSQGL